MMDINCRKIRSLLSPFLDDELTPGMASVVSDHLKRCATCQQEFAEITQGREWVSAAREVPVPPTLQRDVRQRLAGDPPSRRPSRSWSPAAAVATAAVILIAAISGWHVSRGVPPSSSPGASITGPPLDLQRLSRVIAREGDARTLTGYQLRQVNLEEALTRASFKVFCPLQMEPGEQPDHRHVTELRSCPLVHLDYLRGEHRIVVLQQPAGWPIVYGGSPVEHFSIDGQPCDRLQIDGQEILKWERGGTRSILIASGNHPEIRKVARALIASS